MKKCIFTVKGNTKLTDSCYRMTLSGDTSDIVRPGQFVNIMLDGFYLRRPISVCDLEDGMLTIIYKIVGDGTYAMSRMTSNAKLDLLTGLGNGFDVKKGGDRPLLIGGGVGSPPMYLLAKKLLSEGSKPTVLLGFGNHSEVILEDEFKALDVDTRIATADGSYGVRGFVTDAMGDIDYSFIYACGPEPMLKAIDGIAKTSGEFSFEERMGCGFGACMGCTCETKYGAKRICRDGPVLQREEIIW